MRSLSELKAKPPHRPPRNHESLQVLLDKIIISSSTPSSSKSSASRAKKTTPDSDVEIIEHQQAPIRRQLQQRKTSDSDCWVVSKEPVSFDFSALTDIFNEDHEKLAICDELALPVDTVNDAAAESREQADEDDFPAVDVIMIPSVPSISAAVVVPSIPAVPEDGDDFPADFIMIPSSISAAVVVPSIPAVPEDGDDFPADFIMIPSFPSISAAVVVPPIPAVPAARTHNTPIDEIYKTMPKAGGMTLEAIYATQGVDAVVGPSPREYLQRNAERKDKSKKKKGKKPKAKKKAKAKRKKKQKTVNKTKVQSASSAVVEARRQGLSPTDPITFYLSWDGIAPTKSIMKERVRSKGWHLEFDRRSANGEPREVCIEKARESGRECIRRWLEHFPDQ